MKSKYVRWQARATKVYAKLKDLEQEVRVLREIISLPYLGSYARNLGGSVNASMALLREGMQECEDRLRRIREEEKEEKQRLKEEGAAGTEV